MLQRHAGGNVFLENLLEDALARHALPPRDRALCQELACGAVRWQRTLDWLIARKTAGRAQKAGLQALLRLGLYQLFWLDRIPDHAAVNETVALARQFGFGPQSGFVNAILRGFLREREATERLLAGLKESEPALAASHPDWLFARWRDRWGPDRAGALMEWNNTPPRAFVRVNTLKAQPEKLLTRWRMEEGIEYDLFVRPWLPENTAFEFKVHKPFPRLDSFREGGFYVQDPSTLLAAHLLAPRPGESILDLCAAPGGKATYLAQLMGNQGRIVACDVDPPRLARLRENCARLGATCVEPALLPGALAGGAGAGAAAFDRVLVDAPCSNTGVMRRRVDLRWRLRPEEIERLRALQLDLLRRAAPRLKPGGVLVYSTCSLEREENEAVVEGFLGTHPEFHCAEQRALWPFADGVDGAFAARLVKLGGGVDPAVQSRHPTP